jgi:hypothetical protein
MGDRLIDRDKEPTPSDVAVLIGAQNYARWKGLIEFINARYPGVFIGEWLYGGQKHGWTLRFKKSRSFCTLVPERDTMKVLVVFGAAEREKVASVLGSLKSHARDDYVSAHTYHDGKWVLIDADSDEAVSDIEALLQVKRRPSG